MHITRLVFAYLIDYRNIYILTLQVYDYLDVVKHPMDFDQMQSKLDNHDYSCAQDFLDDIDLVAENAIKYNGDPNYETNKIICHRARALQDFAYALVKAEMDTDFEEDCKEIVRRRKSLTSTLKKTEKETEKKYFSIVGSTLENGESATTNLYRKRKPRRKISKWQRGYTPKPKKAKDKSDKDDQMDPNGTEKEMVGEEHGNNHDDLDENGNSDEHSETVDDIEDEDSRLSAAVLDISCPSANEITSSFELNEEHLIAVEDDLVKQTDNYPVEHVERIYCHFMDIVRKYLHRNDRNNLIDTMRRGLPNPSAKANPTKS